MAEGDLVVVRHTFFYTGDNGESVLLTPGQLIQLKGLRNDENLLRQQKFAPAPKKVEPVECGECGAMFVDDTARNIHGNKLHS